jgi:hypothetical protein
MAMYNGGDQPCFPSRNFLLNFLLQQTVLPLHASTAPACISIVNKYNGSGRLVDGSDTIWRPSLEKGGTNSSGATAEGRDDSVLAVACRISEDNILLLASVAPFEKGGTHAGRSCF